MNVPISFFLPYPPTVNHYYVRCSGHRRLRLTEAAKDFRRQTVFTIRSLDFDKAGLSADTILPLKGRLRLIASIHPPDRRKRDIDNTLKALLDALQHAGVYENDDQIVDLQVRKHTFDERNAGGIMVTIEEPNDGHANDGYAAR